jgi:acetoin utilization protein AcuB
MRVEGWMKHPVHTAKPLDSIEHARETMERYRINQLPVVVDGHLLGIVTDRDLRDAFPSALEHPRRARKDAVDPKAVTVETVMSSPARSLGPRDLVEDAARLMRRERIGAIPVVDRERLVGILTRSDVLEAFVELSQSACVAAG